MPTVKILNSQTHGNVPSSLVTGQVAINEFDRKWFYRGNDGLVHTGTIFEQLTAPRTLYVRADGNDNNDGSANTSGSAFLTIQAAVNAAYRLDFNGNNVTIQVNAGTYTSPVVTNAPFLNGGQLGGSLLIKGDLTTPSNVVVSTTNNYAFLFNNQSNVQVGGFKITTSGSGSAIGIFTSSCVQLCGKMEFGAVAWWAFDVENNAYCQTSGFAITISGSMLSMIACFGCSEFQTNSGSAWTISGSPAWGTCGVDVEQNSYCKLSGSTWTGTATGTRFICKTGGVIDTGGQATTWIPGSVAGTGTNFSASPWGLYV